MWGPPAEPNGVITGYQLSFSESFPVNATESYHVVTEDNIRNLRDNIPVKVKAPTMLYSCPFRINLYQSF